MTLSIAYHRDTEAKEPPTNLELARHVAAAAVFNYHRAFIDMAWRPMSWTEMNEEQRAIGLYALESGIQATWKGR